MSARGLVERVLARFGYVRLSTPRFDYVIGAGVDVVCNERAVVVWREEMIKAKCDVEVATGSRVETLQRDWRRWVLLAVLDAELWSAVVEQQVEPVGAWLATQPRWRASYAPQIAQMVALFPCPVERLYDLAWDKDWDSWFDVLMHEVTEEFACLRTPGR